MSITTQVIYLVVVTFWLLFLMRFVIGAARMFSVGWVPSAGSVVVIEAVYTLTDPPVKLLHLLIKPFRIGNMVWDFGFYIVLIGLTIARFAMRAPYAMLDMSHM